MIYHTRKRGDRCVRRNRPYVRSLFPCPEESSVRPGTSSVRNSSQCRRGRVDIGRRTGDRDRLRLSAGGRTHLVKDQPVADIVRVRAGNMRVAHL